MPESMIETVQRHEFLIAGLHDRLGALEQDQAKVRADVAQITFGFGLLSDTLAAHTHEPEEDQ